MRISHTDHKTGDSVEKFCKDWAYHHIKETHHRETVRKAISRRARFRLNAKLQDETQH